MEVRVLSWAPIEKPLDLWSSGFFFACVERKHQQVAHAKYAPQPTDVEAKENSLPFVTAHLEAEPQGVRLNTPRQRRPQRSQGEVHGTKATCDPQAQRTPSAQRNATRHRPSPLLHKVNIASDPQKSRHKVQKNAIFTFSTQRRQRSLVKQVPAQVAELVDALVSGTSG